MPGRKLHDKTTIALPRTAPTASRALVTVGLLLVTTAGCATAAGNYAGYENYEQLDEAADIVIRAEVLDDRRDLAGGPASPSRIADVKITAASKGEVVVGDEITLHYEQAQNSDFRLHELDSYIVFATLSPEDGEAYVLSDAQGTYGPDGTHVMGFEDDQVVLPPAVLAALG
ncbi:hypothetical protein WDV85_16645 [Pseudokineococcus sp. 5B2Z-1]|uniref:hypothetical protein n=1 Tax=Pseudokineococcus sp. 5B2Z-1 TaxID=3132744 RepID=UPI0030AB37D1